MGDAYTALSEDAHAILWNPAGLASLQSSEIAATHLIYVEDTSNSSLFYARPTGDRGGAGLSVQYFSPGQVTARDTADNPIGDFHGYSGAVTLAYGHRFGEDWSFGISGKALQSKIDDVSAQAYAAGGGFRYHPSDIWWTGGAIDNLGSDLKFLQQSDPLPFTGRLGAAYLFEDELTIALEGSYKRASGVAGHVGLEWPNNEGYAFRVGCNTERRRELFGLAGASAGLNLRLLGNDFAYTWTPYADLGTSHLLTMIFRFGSIRGGNRGALRMRGDAMHVDDEIKKAFVQP